MHESRQDRKSGRLAAISRTKYALMKGRRSSVKFVTVDGMDLRMSRVLVFTLLQLEIPLELECVTARSHLMRMFQAIQRGQNNDGPMT